MIFRTLMLCLLPLFCQAAIKIPIFGTNIAIGGQANWIQYGPGENGDAPEGGFLADIGASPGLLDAVVTLNQTVAAGTYRIFVKSGDYDSLNSFRPQLGGGSNTIIMDDRDVFLYWSTNNTVTSTFATNKITITFVLTNDHVARHKVFFRALYITSDPDELVLSNDRALAFTYNDGTNTTAAVKGNLIENGSFECGLSHGVGLREFTDGTKSSSIIECWDTNTAWHGNASMKLPCSLQLAYTKPIICASNKVHTLSVYAKSDGTNTANLRFQNVYTNIVPAGLTIPQGVSTAVAVSNGWTRISITNIVLAYPAAEIALSVWGSGPTNYSVWFDGWQLEEGTLTDFAPANPVEIGLFTLNPGNVFRDHVTNTIQLIAFNTGSNSVNQSVTYEIFDYFNRAVTNGTVSVSIPGGSPVRQDFALPYRPGYFRSVFSLANVNRSDDEFVWSAVGAPAVAGTDTNSNFGTHPNAIPFVASVVTNAGFKWARQLSPGAYGRWEFAETSRDTYVFFDSAMTVLTNAGLSILMNIGEVPPAWTATTYFEMTNVTGTFTAGEQVRSAVATGLVAVVLGTPAHALTGLQLSNVTGTFVVSGLITGQTSTAKSQPSTTPFVTFNLNDWEDFVDDMATHYSNSVAAMEIWNEPNQSSTTYIPTTTFYAEVLRRAMIKIKAANTNMLCVGFGGVLTTNYIDAVLALLPTTWTNYVDVFSIHLYIPNGPASYTHAQASAARWFNTPIWNTESSGAVLYGSIIGPNSNLRTGGQFIQEYKSGDLGYLAFGTGMRGTAQTALESLGGGAAKFFYYDFRYIRYPYYFDSTYSIFDSSDQLSSVGTAVSQIRKLLEYSTGQGPLTLNDANTSAYLFNRAGTPLVAIWSKTQTNKFMTLDNNITAADIKIYDVMAATQQVEVDLIIPYTEMPILIEGQGGLSISNLTKAFTNGTVSVRADTYAPALAIMERPRGALTNQPVLVRWLAIDDKDVNEVKYRYKLSSGSFSDWSGNTWVHYDELAGPHTFTVEAKDLSDNTSTNTISFGEAPILPKVTIGGKVTISGKVSIQ